jgi:hypothetical protein
MDFETVEPSLLQAIEAGRLVLVCGAGVSMDSPTSIPCAGAVANVCFDEYEKVVPGGLNEADRDNLEAIAEYFIGTASFESYFISRLVPWHLFAVRPNAGHQAVADMLLCKAVAATATTNYERSRHEVLSTRSWTVTPPTAKRIQTQVCCKS